MTDIPPATLRQAALVMADWLEGRHFGVTSLSDDDRTAALCAYYWAEGYRRAIHELRWAAREPDTVPDDPREIDGL